MSDIATLPNRQSGLAHTRAAVLKVHHWTDGLFSFRVTRSPGFRFENGQFIMVGLEVDGRRLMRAYSIASPNYEDYLEFLSIKVPDGPLTSRLCHIQPDAEVLIGVKPTGSLLLADLAPGKTLYLLATGTGLAPFMSLVRDLSIYDKFDKVILVHCVRYHGELAYRQYLSSELPLDDYVGEQVRRRLLYIPIVTRESYDCGQRITDLIDSGRLFSEWDLQPFDRRYDRVMICGGPGAVKDLRMRLDSRGFVASPGVGEAGDYVFERAFVES